MYFKSMLLQVTGLETQMEKEIKNALLTSYKQLPSSKDLNVLHQLYIETTYSAPEIQPWMKCSKKHL